MNADSLEDFDRAGAIWSEGLAKYPDSALLKVKLAWNHWTLGWDFRSAEPEADFETAHRLVSEVLARDDLTPEARRSAHWLKALVSMQRGDFERSVDEARVAIEIAPYDGRMLRYLTEVLIATGQYELALEWLATAEPREPARASRYTETRANIYRLMGRYEDAVRLYATLEPPLWHYHALSRAIAYVGLGRTDEARAEVARVVQGDPVFSQARWRESSFYSDPAVLDAEVAALAAAGLPP